jgi:RNA polymerase sigma factor (sigma-70 family)
MTSGRFGATYRQIETLMRIGPIGNLSDGQLLERFLDRREGGEAAFESLVARHGSMVLAVCRRVLGSADEADDAFQATFVVLVRQAGSIQKKESLGPWLHGVARRVSMRARRDAARRRARERIGFRVVGSPLPDDALAETLHDEIARLPEKYRTPIVLCDLEGQTHAEAARRLDWPIGTVSGRLSRARALLRSRIARRGVPLSIGAIATALGAEEAKAAVGPRLIARTTAVASGQLTGLHVRPSVTALAAASSRATGMAWAKIAAGLLTAAGLGLCGIEASQKRTSPPPVVASAARPSFGLPAALDAPRRRQIEDEREIVSVALAPDGLTLASGSLDATVTLWDLETGLEKTTLLGHSAAIRSLAFTRDGRLLTSASEDHTIKVWDVASGLETLTVTWLETSEPPADDLGTESLDPGRNADGTAREADISGV